MDVSGLVRPGENIMKIIQLSDQSNYVFVLHASRPSEEAVQKAVRETAQWESLYERTLAVGESRPANEEPSA